MGTNGLSVHDGLTDNDWEVVQVKKALLKSAGKTALLCLSEKIGLTQKIQVCPLNSIRYLCTELPASSEKIKKYSIVSYSIY